MEEMHMIDRNKIESSVPLSLDRASSVPSDAKGDTFFIDETICTVVEDHPNG